MELNKQFFKEHPLDGFCTAAILEFEVNTIPLNELQEQLKEEVLSQKPPEVREQADREEERIRTMSDPEEIMDFVRKGYNKVNRYLLIQRCLELQETVMPVLLRRYRTTALDEVIEFCSIIFCMGDRKWAEELFQIYPRIRNNYAQSLACAVFGLHDMEDRMAFLMKEYERFEREYDGTKDGNLKDNILFALKHLYEAKQA